MRDDTRLERAHASQMRASDAGCPDLRVTRHHRRVRLASSYPPLYPPLTRPSPHVPPGKSTRCAARRRRARLRRSTRAAAARRRSPFADRTRAARPKVIRKKCKCLRRCARRFSSSPVWVARRRCSRAARISATRRASPPRRTKTTKRKAGARVRAGLSRRTRRESAVRARGRRGAARRGGGAEPSASDPASVAAAMRDYERRLGEKEAHLRMLRSRPEMAERDGETARRRPRRAGPAERERARERNAAAGGFGYVQGDVRGFGQNAETLNGTNGRRGAPGSNSIHTSLTHAGGPAPMEVSNAAALQEARAELARLRARVAFKDEEAEEARRREDEQRASLRRSEAEAMRLAAEVRKERRRAAAAEGDARARVKEPPSEKNGAATKANAEASDETANRVKPRVFPGPKRASMGATRNKKHFLPRRRCRWCSPAAGVAGVWVLVGPRERIPGRRRGVRGDRGRRADGGARHPGVRGFRWGSRFARERYVVVRRRRGARGVPPAGRPERPRRGRRHRRVLRGGGGGPRRRRRRGAQAEALRRAEHRRRRVRRARRRYKNKRECIPVARVVPARRRARRDVRGGGGRRADASAAATLARLFGVADAAPTHVAPRPPPEPLAGVPAAGTDHVGSLAPHPGARGGFELETRVFAPASALWGLSPEGPEGANVGASGEVRNGRADFSIGDDRPFGDDRTFGTLFGTTRSSTRDDGTGTFSTPSPFLSSVLVILSSSLSAGDWFAARAALRLLSRAAAEADPLRARGFSRSPPPRATSSVRSAARARVADPGSKPRARHPPRRCGRRTRRTRRRRLRAAPATPIGRAVRTENKRTDYIRARSRLRGPRTRNGTFRDRARPRACAATRSRSCGSSRRPPSSRRRSPAPPRRDSPPSETRFRG